MTIEIIIDLKKEKNKNRPDRQSDHNQTQQHVTL